MVRFSDKTQIADISGNEILPITDDDISGLDKKISLSQIKTFIAETTATIKTKLDAETVVSGSSQINITSTTGFSTFSASIETRISLIDGGTY